MQLADRNLTPGLLNTGVSLADILTPGYARKVRPNRAVSFILKVAALRRYGIKVRLLRHYILDHLVPLECGGHPSDPFNLWPQPATESRLKDVDENNQRALLAAGKVTLEDVFDFFVVKWSA